MKTRTTLSLLAAGLIAAGLTSIYAADTKPQRTPGERQAHFRASGQHPPRAQAMRERRAVQRHIARRLDLSDAQKAQMKAVREKTREALGALRADTSLTPEQKRAKFRETAQAARAEMRALLTPEQQAKMEKIRKHLHKKPSGHRGPGEFRGPRGPQGPGSFRGPGPHWRRPAR